LYVAEDLHYNEEDHTLSPKYCLYLFYTIKYILKVTFIFISADKTQKPPKFDHMGLKYSKKGTNTTLDNMLPIISTGYPTLIVSAP
jgi:hypothetical protein